MRKTIITTAVTATILALSGTPATARESSKAVRHSDLDLSRPDDVVTLQHRITRALETVCGSYASAESFQYEEIDRCRAQARTQATAEFARVMNEAAKRRLAAR